MSVRIYQLSKEVGMTNKEVIALLKERGLDVDSPSNTIPNIYADSFLQEFKQKSASNAAPPPPQAQESISKPSSTLAEARPGETPTPRPALKSFSEGGSLGAVGASTAPAKEDSSSKAPLLPPAEPKVIKTPIAPPPITHFVKSSQQIEEEKRKAEEAKRPVVIKPPTSLPQRPPFHKPETRFATPQTSSQPPRPSSQTLPHSKTSMGMPTEGHKIGASAPGSARADQQRQAPTPPKIAPLSHLAPKTTLPPSENKVDLLTKTIRCKPPIVVRDFALLLDIKPFRLISELMEMGIFASMNQTIEVETAQKIASKHGFTLEIHHRGEVQAPVKEKKPEPTVDDAKLLVPRPPIVCVLGHVDHGKTSLLDTIRKTNVAAGEAGGITQHTGAYQVEHKGQKITFIDTPGHAAFSKMRERGANITDIAILVVAADDTFMPQTDEALKFAKKANVPVVVAINKMDVKGANPDRVKQQMQERGITPEEWGGETLTAQVSATKGTNIDQLLDLILLQAEMLELKANPNSPPEGVVLESQVEIGLGSTTNIIVQKGTLKLGDVLVAGSEFCKVRAMIDDKGQRVQKAEPSKPLKVLGWSGTPDSGTIFKAVKNEKEAKQLIEDYTAQQKRIELQAASSQPMSLDHLMNAIAQSQQKALKVLIKGDVHGSVEALKACLEDIKSNKVKLEIIGAEIGPINKNDIVQAHTGGATIVGFNTKFDVGAQAIAKHHNVNILQHNIIYELITQVKEAMAELLEPELQETKIGAAQVRNVFELSKAIVAGCMVTEGRLTRDAYGRVLRPKQTNPVHQGRIGSIKRFKEDVSEVRAGYECGIQLENFNSFQVGDIIECFEIKKIRPSL